MQEKCKEIVQDAIPEIYCSITIIFDKDINIPLITGELEQIGIKDIEITKPKYASEIDFDIAVIKYEKLWYLNDALTKMFSHVDHCLVELKTFIEKYKGRPLIDVAFRQYGTYPALEFVGENMKKIRFLEADISIDPY